MYKPGDLVVVENMTTVPMPIYQCMWPRHCVSEYLKPFAIPRLAMIISHKENVDYFLLFFSLPQLIGWLSSDCVQKLNEK